MSVDQGHPGDEGLASLAIDPDVLARELEAELVGDPLDEIELEGFDIDPEIFAPSKLASKRLAPLNEDVKRLAPSKLTLAKLELSKFALLQLAYCKFEENKLELLKLVNIKLPNDKFELLI